MPHVKYVTFYLLLFESQIGIIGWINFLSNIINLHKKELSVAAAAAAKSLQLCPTLCNPTDSTLPGSSSLEFSRQEHWGGLPFHSPMHESEKWKWSCLVVSDSSRPHGLQPTRLLHPWDFPGKSAGVGCHCLLHLPSLCSQNFWWCVYLELFFAIFDVTVDKCPYRALWVNK